MDNIFRRFCKDNFLRKEERMEKRRKKGNLLKSQADANSLVSFLQNKFSFSIIAKLIPASNKIFKHLKENIQ